MKFRILAPSLVLAGSAALAHVVFVVKGVHFKSEPIDFGQPPSRRSDSFDDGTGGDEAWRPGTLYRRGFWEDDEAREARDAALQKRLITSSARDELAGRVTSARRAYVELQSRRMEEPNFLASRIELLSIPNIEKSVGYSSFIRATNPRSRGPLPKKVGAALRPWIAYLSARTAAEYAEVAARFPHSDRAPAGLIMAARGLVNRANPHSTVTARSYANQLLSSYAKSRFAWDARGILGRIAFIHRQYGEAERQYEGQVATAKTSEQRAVAFQSLIECSRRQGGRAGIAHAALRWSSALDANDPYLARHFFLRTLEHFSASDARSFYSRLARDPQSFADYLELRSSIDTAASDVLALANNARRSTAGTKHRGRVDSILARVALVRGDRRAASFAHDAQRGTGADRAVGTFVLATIDRRAGRFAKARNGYRRILREAPTNYLAGGARENLAIVSERLGDLSTALDQYLQLGYQQDVAFVTDAKMTPAQLESYVKSHPQPASLRYTLAMRYLRLRDWDGAERALSGLTSAQRKTMTSAFVYPETAASDGGLQDPAATLEALRKLDEAVTQAKGEDEKAKALAAMGDYYYAHRCLLLYSGPAWRGWRNTAVSFSWNAAVATPADENALRAHYDEHECYVQALACYRQVVRDYPNSKIAGHAAYRGAVALQRLSNMAPYWRWRERDEDHKGEAVRLMEFATQSSDPAVVKKAQKYGPVFSKERDETRAAFSQEKSPARRWNSQR